MRLAIDEAEDAGEAGEVPVGAIIVREGEVVARAGNAGVSAGDATAHAELLAIQSASAVLGDQRLSGCTLYVTLEPCAMCAGAMVNARVARLVYAATDPKAGAVASLYELCSDPRLNHRLPIVAGLHAEAAAELLRGFFAERRS